MAKQENQAGVVTTTVGAVANLPAGMKIKRVITVPSLVMKTQNEGRFLRFDEKIHPSKVPGKVVDGKQEKPANVALVTDIATGEQLNFLVPAVVIANLNEEYPAGAYVGKIFAIQNVGKRENKRYTDFRIAECEKE